VTIRLAILCGLALGLLAGASVGRDDDDKGNDPEPPYRTRRYASPKACFDAYAKATEKKDYKTAFDCLSPEAQKDQAAFTVYALSSLPANLPDEFKKMYKPVLDVLDKHGLTEKARKDFKGDGFAMKMPEKARLGLRKLIKKPQALLLDLTAAQEKMMKDGGLPAVQANPKFTLNDLKVKGDKASGKMVMSFSGTELKQSVEFVKLNVGWKMVPSMEYEGLGGGAPAPAPADKDKDKKK
jgi:hypothetical protein